MHSMAFYQNLKGWGFFLYVEINKLILKVMEMLMVWKSQHNIGKDEQS